MTSPMNVSTFGDIFVSARPRTIAYRSTLLALPNALVQVICHGQCGTAVPGCGVNHYPSSCIVDSFNISSSRLPPGVTTTAVSPTFFPTNDFPIGDVVDIKPLVTSLSSLVTSLYSIFSS